MKTITADLIHDLVAQAGTNARQRINYNIHESFFDPVQRMFMAARLATYFRPHRHPTTWEFAVVTQGLFDVMVFDDTGRVMERISVGPGADVVGFELPQNTWHVWVPMVDESVFLEIKQGPYDAQTASVFADWSPVEGSTDVNEFIAQMRAAKVGDLITCCKC
jgi:cupin fold WbuC family metalloprotein